MSKGGSRRRNKGSRERERAVKNACCWTVSRRILAPRLEEPSNDGGQGGAEAMQLPHLIRAMTVADDQPRWVADDGEFKTF